MELFAVKQDVDRTPRPRWTLMLMLLYSALLPWSSAYAQHSPQSKPRDESRSLPLPSRTSSTSESDASRAKSISPANGLVSTAISLGLIVGTLLLVGRWMKRNGFQGSQSLPIEAFEVLGRRSLEPRATVHLVRFGSRVLLLGIGTDGIRTLSEIDDPAEVESLTVACQQPTKNEKPATQSGGSKLANTTSNSSPLVQRVFTALMTIGLCFAAIVPVQAQPGSRSSAVGNRQREQAEAGHHPRQREVQPAEMEQAEPGTTDPQPIVSPQQLGLSLKMLALMTVFSLAPSILMMTTCFVRFIVVLGLLRQAIGTQQGPPNQVLTAICLFLTFLVMSPIWQRCYQEGIRPYTNPVAGDPAIDEAMAISRTIAPVRTFMSQQIEKAGNADAVWMLLDFQRPASESPGSESWQEPQNYDEVPFTVLAPAYLLSELKVGFLIGFQLFLPFLIIDLVVAMILTSLGLTMLPPSMVSLPFKLLLFVLIDGWFLTVGMLLESVRVT